MTIQRGHPISLFAPLERVDDEQRLVLGVATSETPVQDIPGVNIILDWEATKRAVADWQPWGNIREMHQLSAVGVAREIGLDDGKRLVNLTSYIVDEEAWAKVKARVYKGYSIKFDPRKWEMLDKGATIRVTEYDIIEISLVDKPADPTATISLWRAVGGVQFGPVWVACGDMSLYYVVRDTGWDADAALQRVRERATEGERVNWVEYERAFLLYDASNPEQFESYQLQFADVVTDRSELVIVQEAVYNMAMALPGLYLPEHTRRAVERRIETLYHQMGRYAPWEYHRVHSMQQQGGEQDMSKILDQVWERYMGKEVQVPGTPDEAWSILSQRAASDLGQPAGQGAQVVTPGQPDGNMDFQRTQPILTSLASRLDEIETRLKQLEQAPAPLPLARGAAQEQSIREKISDLEHTIQSRRLPPESKEVRQLLKLSELARRQDGRETQ